MSRLVDPNSTGAMRERHRRTIAEALHLMAGRQELDDQARDILAILILSLRAIHAGIEQSAAVWDRRHYHIRAEQLRANWAWTARYADRLRRLVESGDGARIPVVLAELAPHFADIRVARITRSDPFWRGAYGRLRSAAAARSPGVQ